MTKGAIMAKKAKAVAVAEYFFHFGDHEGEPLRLGVDRQGTVYISRAFAISAWGFPYVAGPLTRGCMHAAFFESEPKTLAS